VDTIVVHQAAGPGTTSGIAKYHSRPGPGNHISKKGAVTICYHYSIEKDGKIVQCNDLTDIVWHAGMRDINNRSIGILVLGNFDGPTHTGTEAPTSRQMESLKELLTYYKNKHIPELPIIPLERFFGHRDVKTRKENCPGHVIMAFLRAYRSF
jgi:N-acetyl-anhydromuramyl-L-alanine amidase AmpD